MYSVYYSPNVLLVRLALPGVDGDTPGCHGGRSMVLGRENVAGGPRHLEGGDKYVTINKRLENRVRFDQIRFIQQKCCV